MQQDGFVPRKAAINASGFSSGSCSTKVSSGMSKRKLSSREKRSRNKVIGAQRYKTDREPPKHTFSDLPGKQRAVDYSSTALRRF